MLRYNLVIGLISMLGITQLSANELWQPVSTSAPTQLRSEQGTGQSLNRYSVDPVKLRQVLSRAVSEVQVSPESQITLPVGKGSIQAFSLEESPILAAELAAKYPDIKTYKVYGIDDPHASGRLSMTSKGFHGMITGPAGTLYIDPEANNTYKVQARKTLSASQPFSCEVEGHDHHSPVGFRSSPAFRTPDTLKVYRLAVAGTAEYVAAVGPDVTTAYAEIIIAINRVNQIYERDLAIRLNLVSDTSLLHTNTATDNYTNFNGSLMLDENQVNIDAELGSSEYDIGHVFSTGGGGIAQVGAVCNDLLKAQGVSGLGTPTGDAFFIDYVAHEIGHQFGAEHTFNGTSVNCAGNRVAISAYEPGSGSTIMSYAGICGGETIQQNSDAFFHAGTIDQIDTFTTSGNGNSCFTPLSANNLNEPTANAGSDFTIPRETPFILSANANDGDGDTLSYAWDQIDLGSATTTTTLGTDLGDNPLFRSYLPGADAERHFPALGTTLQNKYDDSEVLACKTRDLNFRLSVRDGKSGLAHDDMIVSVDNASGPFEITTFNSPTTPLSPGEYQLDWNVANTDRAPVNCNEVDISLLAFNTNKTTYTEIPLHTNESNSGTFRITVPNNDIAVARLKLQCSDNIFYDISDADLRIAGVTSVSTNDKDVFYNSGNESLVLFDNPAEVCTTDASQPPIGDPEDGGSGAVGLWWLLLISLGVFGNAVRVKAN